MLTLYCLRGIYATQCQNFDLRMDHQKNSYERRDYESVDEKSLPWVMYRKTMKKRIQAVKG